MDITITINIPDDITERLQERFGDLSRWFLELLAVHLHKSGQLTSPQAQEMLGIDRFELDGVLKAYGVLFDYSPEQLAREEETSRKL